MSEPSRPEFDAAEPPVLGYRPAADDRASVSRVVLCVTAAGVATVVFFSVPGAILLGFGLQSEWAFALVPALFVALVVLAVRFHRRGSRAAALGIWLGMGVGLLAEGLCFGLLLTR